MKHCWLLFPIICVILLSSCSDNFDTIPNTGNLTFSRDTVYLNTVFTNISSSTYQLKVYNKNNQSIHIPSIKLALGEASAYRLNVDGIPGKSFSDIQILANDSLYVFIETTIDFSQVSDPLYTDKIIFDTNENQQNIELVTLVQDAYFLYPSKNAQGIIKTIEIGNSPMGKTLSVQGFYLDKSTIFTNEKPYVIYGYCAIPSGKTLTVEAGARVYFHANSGMIVDNGATLKLEGTLEENIIIEGDRLQPQFENKPGQWGTIWLRAGSTNHSINYTTIKNGEIGIMIDSIGNTTNPTLTIKNTQLYNHSTYGILGRNTYIQGENIVINNVGLSSIACTGGGTYEFSHCTFSNFWNQSIRQSPTVLVNNYSFVGNGGIASSDLKEATFVNCIISGNKNIELVLDNEATAEFHYNFKNNLIKFDDFNNTFVDIPEYNFEDINHFQNNIFNKKPDFKDPYENNLKIGVDSNGNNQANLDGASKVAFDILGVNRTISPDIGAYQHQVFEE
jgi:hypothetical protein|tara:strand:- start:46175 stop:47689 length:1515 start_codon:yes stop_codon:yes gene_type:complete